MTDHPRVEAARARAEAARARLRGSLYEAKARLSPAAMADRAVDAARDQAVLALSKTVERAKRRPALLTGVAGAAALWLARGPIARMFGHSGKPADAPAVTPSNPRKRTTPVKRG